MNNIVVPFRAPARRNVRGTKVEAGQTAFAIQDQKTRLYFIWAYSDETYANKIASRVKPESEVDIQANWRRTLERLTISDRRKD